MNTVQVKNTVIGEGRPKICIPIVGKTKTDILEEAKKITALPVDVVEWRVDWFDDVFATEKVLETAKELREVLKDIPVLLTFRTSKEGGEKEISVSDYAALNIAAAQSGYVDLIDVEAFTGDDVVKTIIDAAHEAGVKVIASNHDFFKTPEKEEIIRRPVHNSNAAEPWNNIIPRPFIVLHPTSLAMERIFVSEESKEHQ